MKKNAKCDHVAAGGTFRYYGEGPGATRCCLVCDYTEICYAPNPKIPYYVQWKPKNQTERPRRRVQM